MKRILPLITGLLLFVLSVVCTADVNGQFYNGSQLSFGKNRVQYEQFLWTFYQFDNFDTYFYLNGKELALFTAKYAENNIALLERRLETNLNDKIQFIIFNNLSDLKQSNIGLISDDQYNTGGVTHIIGNKVFLYFDGSYTNFKKQIRAGITHIILNNMMFGGSIGSQIKNSTLFILPDWYLNGLISYFSEDWSTVIDNRVKDGVQTGSYDKFNHLTGEDAVYAGHSLWKYIAERYGKSAIPNIVHMTKISRSIENGILYVLGMSFKSIVDEWLSFAKQHYALNTLQYLPDNPVLKKVKEGRYYSQVKVSPDGQSVAYSTNDRGKYKVFMFDVEKRKSKRLFKAGFRMDDKTDYSYPLIEWHPSGRLLAYILERKGENWLYFYNLEDRKHVKQLLVNFEKVTSFKYSADGRYLLMSAIQNGQSDLYIYNIASGSHDRLTHDPYDDLHASFLQNDRKIIFSSNRPSDTLQWDTREIPIDILPTYDLYLYDYASRSPILRRVTNTPLANEMQAAEYEKNYFTYISDENGIYNQYIGRFDSAIAYVDTITHWRYFSESYAVTNYSRNINELNVEPAARKSSTIIYHDERYHLYMSDMPVANQHAPLNLEYTPYMRSLRRDLAETEEEGQGAPAKKASRTYRKRFRTVKGSQGGDQLQEGGDGNIYEFDRQNFISFGEGVQRQNVADKDGFRIPKRRNYNVEFSMSKLVTQVDFSFLQSTYQPFTGGGAPIYLNPGLNALLKVGVTDLMEDYRITGGVRLNVNLINNEYLVSYKDLKKRMDKEIVFHRQALENYGPYSIVRHYIHELYYMLSWPFNEALSLRGTGVLRADKTVYLSTDQVNLAVPDQLRNWAGLKGELVYDDTRNLGVNLYAGTRYKVFAEYNQQINRENQNLIVYGFDVRNYQRIHRTLIWANRLAGSSSVGNNRLIYYMGGVDNWLNPKFTRDTPIDYSQNYAYQTLATNMRGFEQNIRNGNSFLVLNSEVRLPIFRYFFNRPIKSDFVQNFQVVVFGDLGTAWTGWDPYSKDNSLYTSTVEDGPLTITVEVQKDPIVGGYGFGLRSRLLGYFLRADWAWGVEDGYTKPSVFYLSLSLDF